MQQKWTISSELLLSEQFVQFLKSMIRKISSHATHNLIMMKASVLDDWIKASEAHNNSVWIFN